MNVAFPALLAFLILLPGFIFRSRLKLAERTSLDYSPFGQIVTEAILWAVACHLLWLTLTYLLFARSLDPTLLMKLLVSEPGGQASGTAGVGRDFQWVSAYFVTLLLASYAVPTLARIFITKHRMDRDGAKYSAVFRFHEAPWYYLLTGADFAIGEVPDAIAVSALVDVTGNAFLFTGILQEFFIDAQGQLDRLVLREVMRRPIASDKTQSDTAATSQTPRFYPVDGDYFVLRYSEGINLNVKYVKYARLADTGE